MVRMNFQIVGGVNRIVIPSEVEKSRGSALRQRHGILQLRCAPLRMTASRKQTGYTAPGLGTGVGRGLGVARGLGVGVGLAVPVGLAVAVAVGVTVGVPVAVAVGVGVGVPPGTRKA